MPPYTEIDTTSPDDGPWGPALSGSPFNRNFGPFIDPTAGMLNFGGHSRLDDNTQFVAYAHAISVGSGGAVLGIGTWNGVGTYDNILTISVGVLDPTGTTWTFSDVKIVHYGQNTYPIDDIPMRFVTDGTDIWLGMLVESTAFGTNNLYIYHFNGTTWDLIQTVPGTLSNHRDISTLAGCASPGDPGIAYFGFSEGPSAFSTLTVTWFTKVNTSTGLWSVSSSFVIKTLNFGFPMANGTGTCVVFNPFDTHTIKQYSLDPTTGAQTHLQDITNTSAIISPIIGNLNPDGISYYLATSGSSSPNNLYEVKADGSSNSIFSTILGFDFVVTTNDGSGNVRDIWISCYGSSNQWRRYDSRCMLGWRTTTFTTTPTSTGVQPNDGVAYDIKPFITTDYVYTFGFYGSSSFGLSRTKLEYVTCPSDTHPHKRLVGFFRNGSWELVPELSGPAISYYRNGEWNLISKSPDQLVAFRDGTWQQALQDD